ncbi:hypothetical protein HYPSUDRAFT_1085541 [Hypholoma sublateritium FD-334 SS-4]|uniref:Uncharacterized protein n=1 Tax=Hypholoma sublateritium (strain FD-334 SS-4) TaxID=945553 RepID=A0A0D2L5A6_HYPSF|nr:hypothetical protein HYPSUDRAFT_1085541 [Hypholoma sublateritium FD-334 SS-4]
MQSPSSDAALLVQPTDELSESRHMPGAWIEDPLPVWLDESVDARETVPTDLTDLPVVPVVPPTSLHTTASTEASVEVSVRERAPSFATHTPSIPLSENSEVESVESTGSWIPDHPLLSLAAHVSKISAEVMALGDDSLIAYQGMLSRLERLQAESCFRGMDIKGSGVQDLGLINPFAQFPQPIVTEYFCEASDIRSALLLRQSINLVAIGDLLADLAQKICLHDEDASIIGRIEREIQHMHEADRQNHFGIQFDTLQHYRSKFSPARGESFSEKHRFLRSHVEEYLEDKDNSTNAASQFLVDPACLMEHRASQPEYRDKVKDMVHGHCTTHVRAAVQAMQMIVAPYYSKAKNQNLVRTETIDNDPFISDTSSASNSEAFYDMAREQVASFLRAMPMSSCHFRALNEGQFHVHASGEEYHQKGIFLCE